MTIFDCSCTFYSREFQSDQGPIHFWKNIDGTWFNLSQLHRYLGQTLTPQVKSNIAKEKSAIEAKPVKTESTKIEEADSLAVNREARRRMIGIRFFAVIGEIKSSSHIGSDLRHVVEIGSLVRNQKNGPNRSVPDRVRKVRDGIYSCGTRQPNGCYVLNSERSFASPTAAIEFCLGAKSSGPQDWKTSEGVTYFEVHNSFKKQIIEEIKQSNQVQPARLF